MNLVNKLNPSSFELSFSLIPGQDDINNIGSLLLNLYDTVLPSFSITPIELDGQGGKVHYEGGGVEYGEGNTTFFINEDFSNYLILFNGMKRIYDGVKRYGSKYEDTQITGFLSIMDNFNNTVCNFQFNRIGPKELGEVSFSYQEGESLISCSCVFQYDFFENVTNV